MKWDEQAERLRRKAAGDEQAMMALFDVPSMPDDVIGFHAQQAIEKLLKSLLCRRRIAFRQTHDLVELLDRLAANGIEIPEEIAEVRQLNPYAAEFRYDDLLDTDEPFNRRWAMQCVERTRIWVDSLLG